MLDDAEIERFISEPPDDTRAYFRSQCLKRYREAISHANWDVLTFDVGGHGEKKVPLVDPTKGTRALTEGLLNESALAICQKR